MGSTGRGRTSAAPGRQATAGAAEASAAVEIVGGRLGGSAGGVRAASDTPRPTAGSAADQLGGRANREDAMPNPFSVAPCATRRAWHGAPFASLRTRDGAGRPTAGPIIPAATRIRRYEDEATASSCVGGGDRRPGGSVPSHDGLGEGDGGGGSGQLSSDVIAAASPIRAACSTMANRRTAPTTFALQPGTRPTAAPNRARRSRSRT